MELAILVLKVAAGMGSFVLLSVGMAYFQGDKKFSRGDKGGHSDGTRKLKM